MRLPRKAAGVALAIACGTVASTVGLSTPASAEVVDPPGLFHIQGWGDAKCLWDSGPGASGLDPLKVYSCHNSGNQQWTYEPAASNVSNNGAGFLIRNHATGRCAQAGPHVVDSTAILMVPCNPNDATQVWGIQLNLNHYVNLASEYCMDRPVQTSYDGEQMQMWQCDTPNGPFGDLHWEQVAIGTSNPE